MMKLMLNAQYDGGITHRIAAHPGSPLFVMFQDAGLQEIICVRKSGTIHKYWREEDAGTPKQ